MEKNMKKVIGYFGIGLIFGFIFVFQVYEHGLWIVLIHWIVVAAIASIFLGCSKLILEDE